MVIYTIQPKFMINQKRNTKNKEMEQICCQYD